MMRKLLTHIVTAITPAIIVGVVVWQWAGIAYEARFATIPTVEVHHIHIVEQSLAPETHTNRGADSLEALLEMKY